MNSEEDYRALMFRLTRLIKVALLARGVAMTRRDLWQILNASRPAMPFLNGELSDALRTLERQQQISLLVPPGSYSDFGSTEISLLKCVP